MDRIEDREVFPVPGVPVTRTFTFRVVIGIGGRSRDRFLQVVGNFHFHPPPRVGLQFWAFWKSLSEMLDSLDVQTVEKLFELVWERLARGTDIGGDESGLQHRRSCVRRYR